LCLALQLTATIETRSSLCSMKDLKKLVRKFAKHAPAALAQLEAEVRDLTADLLCCVYITAYAAACCFYVAVASLHNTQQFAVSYHTLLDWLLCKGLLDWRVCTEIAAPLLHCSSLSSLLVMHIAAAQQEEEEEEQQEALSAKKDARIQKLENRIRRRDAQIERNAEVVEAATDATSQLAEKDAEIARLRSQLKQFESAAAAMAAISRGCSEQSQAVVQSTASSGGSSSSRYSNTNGSSSSTKSSSKSSSNSNSSNSSRVQEQQTSSNQGNLQPVLSYNSNVSAHDNCSSRFF
jgi:hypothetical protein